MFLMYLIEIFINIVQLSQKGAAGLKKVLQEKGMCGKDIIISRDQQLETTWTALIMISF